MQGRGQARAFERRIALLAIQKIDPRAILKGQPVEAADLFQEGNRLLITAHEQMLAVIHNVAGLLIDKRESAPAEMAAPFEQGHRRTALAQLNSRSKSGKSAADDDDAFCRHDFLNLLLSQISRAIFMRRFFETVRRLRKTLNCTPGICSSISR